MKQMKTLQLLLVTLFYVPVFAHESAATDTATNASAYLDGSYIADPGLWGRFSQIAPDWLVGGVPMAIAAMLLFRGLAECMIAIAKRTETKRDDEIAALLSKIAWTMAKGLSWVGVGVPAALLEKKLDQLASEEQNANSNPNPGTDTKSGPSVM
jgi:hypothetical protein